MPQLAGKYFFSDITTGRLFYHDPAELIASQRMRNKQATIHELQIMYQSPYDAASKTPAPRRMYDIVADAYAHKDGVPNPNSKQGVLPGQSAMTGGWRGKDSNPGKIDPHGVAYGGGRADVRLSIGGDGEIYIMTKSDGMIRKFVKVITPPPSSKQSAAR